MTQERKFRSRDISLVDLYNCLQLEYVSYFVRKKIYQKEYAINYSGVCDQKKEKIETISKKNNLPSIFNDIDIKNRYIQMFLNETGEPNFTYKDEEVKNKMSKWDNFYFFAKGSSIKFNQDSKVVLGVVTHNDKANKILTIKDEFKSDQDLHYSSVTRLFPEDFFNF